MIECYEGKLGGGKTYSAVEKMAQYLASGGCVCTNITLKWEAICAYTRSKWGVVPDASQYIFLEQDKLKEFHRHVPAGTKERPTLVVLDEIHLEFNARDWAKASNEVLAFLTQSRKVAVDVIFISQSIHNVDKQWVRMVQFIWRFRDMRKWKIPVLRVRWPFPQILETQFDYSGGECLDMRFKWMDRRIFGMYDTTELKRTFPMLEGHGVGTVKKVGRSARMRWVLLCVVFGCVFGVARAVMAFRRGDLMIKPGELRGNVLQQSPAMPVPVGMPGPVVEARPLPKAIEPAAVVYVGDEAFCYYDGEVMTSGEFQRLRSEKAREALQLAGVIAITATGTAVTGQSVVTGHTGHVTIPNAVRPPSGNVFKKSYR